MFNVARKKWKWVSANPFADVGFSELLKVDDARTRRLILYKMLVKRSRVRHISGKVFPASVAATEA